MINKLLFSTSLVVIQHTNMEIEAEIKITEWEEPELTSPHKHQNYNYIYRATITKPGSFWLVHSKPKCWDNEVCHKKSVCSQGSQVRRRESWSQIHLPEGKGLNLYGIKNKEAELSWWSSGWDFAFHSRGYGFDPWSGAKIPHASWPKNQNTKT